MEEIHKDVNLLYVLHENHILMRKFKHQDSEVLDVFSFKSHLDTKQAINEKLNSLFGKTYSYMFFGTIESTIKKEGATVHLHIKTYKVPLEEKYEVLDSYTDDIVTTGSATI